MHLDQFTGFALALGGALIVSCSGGSGSSGTPIPASFRLTGSNLSSSSAWQLNRPIELAFNRSIDFASVTGNAISVTDSNGVPAVGSFRFQATDMDGDGFAESEDATQLVFVPQGPLLGDLSDAGLLPDTEYTLLIVDGANSIKSVDGDELGLETSISFTTPSAAPFFFDTVAGAPEAVVRPVGSTSTNTASVRLGGDDGDEVFFEFDAQTGLSSLVPAGAELGLDLHRLPATEPVFFVVLNQPISPSAGNLASLRIGLEADVPGEGARFWPSRATLISNDSASGAVVRLEPDGGPLPRGGSLRAVLREGFEDLTGEARVSVSSGFAVAPVSTPITPGVIPESDVVDAVIQQVAGFGSGLTVAGVSAGSGVGGSTVSGWYGLGAADRNAQGQQVPVRFRFDGVDPATGLVPSSNGTVLLDAPVLGPFGLGAAAPDSFLVAEGQRIEILADSLEPWLFTIGVSPYDIYLRAPVMLVGSDLEISNGFGERSFRIEEADYDVVEQRLSLVLASSLGTTPSEFFDAGVGTGSASIVARSFRLTGTEVLDSMPADTAVRFSFQGVGSTSEGAPDMENIVVDWTGNAQDLTSAAPGTVRHFRWRVEFNYDVSGNGLQPGEDLPILEFIRIPFRF